MRNEGRAFINKTLMIEIALVLLVILSGAIIFHYVEGLSLFEGVYFVVSTMSTVGLGDIVPQTQLGKIFTIVYAFLGVPLFLSVSGLILESRFNNRIKSYVSRFHKELHKAEEELQQVEKKIGKELENVIETTEENQDKIENNKDLIEKNEDRIEEVEKKLDKKVKKKSLKKIYG